MKLLPIVLSYLIFSSTQTAFAINSPSVTPSPSPIPTPTVSSDIQKIREAVQQKVKEKLAAITTNQTTVKKAIIGTVTQNSSTEITLEYQNSLRNVVIDTETVFIDSKRNKSSFDKIKTGQGLLCLGYLDPSGTFEAKRIIFIDLKTIDSTEKVIAGKIVDLSQTSSVMVIISPKDKDTQYQIMLDKNTTVFDNTGKKVDVKNLKSGLNVIAIITPVAKSTKSFTAIKIILNQNLSNPTPTIKQP